MVPLAEGSVVLVRFPFSDLSSAKLRPAVVLASANKDDWILCQITSNPYSDTLAIEIKNEDFKDGSLLRTSYARPGKLFTASGGLVATTSGVLANTAFNRIVDGVIALLRKSRKTG